MHFNVLRDDYIPRTAKCTSNGALLCEKKRLSSSQMKIYQREKSNINTLLKWKQKKKAKMKNELQKKNSYGSYPFSTEWMRLVVRELWVGLRDS